MNKKGFTLIEIIGAIILLGIIMIIAYNAFSGNLKVFRDDYYESLDRTLSESGQEFFNDNRTYRPNNILEAQKVPISMLETKGYTDSVKDYGGKACDVSNSYVIIVKESKSEYSYHTCLKCPQDSFDNTDDPYCDNAWFDSNAITYEIGESPNIFVYKGTSRDEVKKLLELPVSYVRRGSDGEIIKSVRGTGDDGLPVILPKDIDVVNPNKVGTYEVHYEFKKIRNGQETGELEQVTGNVTVYQNESPATEISYKNTIAKPNETLSSINGGTTEIEEGTYVSDTWAQEITVNLNLSGDIVEPNVKPARYQWNKVGRWQDFCTANESGACSKPISQDMNENIQFRMIDSKGHISTPTSPIRIKRDKTKPHCELQLSQIDGDNGWYKGNVTISFLKKLDQKTTTDEAISGLNIININKSTEKVNRETNNVTVTHTEDTSSVTYIGYLEDEAQNYTTCNITFKKDGTNPQCTLKVASGTYDSAGFYTSDSITIGFDTKTDATSGVVKFGLGIGTVNYDNIATYVYNGTASSETVTAKVKDEAGNEASCDITVCSRQQRNTRSIQSCTKSCCGTTTKTTYGTWSSSCSTLANTTCTSSTTTKECKNPGSVHSNPEYCCTQCRDKNSTTVNKTCASGSCCGHTSWTGWREDNACTTPTGSSCTGVKCCRKVYKIGTSCANTSSKVITAYFQGNGGSCNNGAEAGCSVAEISCQPTGTATSCTITLPANTYTRTNKSFGGWSTSSTATSGTAAGTTVTLTADTTYYATWIDLAAVTRTLTFNGNSGTGTVANKTCTYTKGEYNINESCEVTLPANGYIRTGYAFVAWGESTTSTQGYIPNYSYALDSNKTLYAIWGANQYSISYTLNGGSYGSSHPASGTYNSVVTISNPTKTVTVTGNANNTGATVGSATSKAQTFASWTSTTMGSNALTGTTNNPTTAWTGTATTNQYFKNLRETGTVTMVATWTPVAFNLPTVTKPGYSCKWNTKADGTGTNYNSGASYTPSATSGASVTVYAICSANGYSIGYTMNNGTNASGNPTSATYDALVTINAPTKTITATGNANGTGADIGAATSKAQPFSGWTSTTMGSNAKTGTTNNPATAWAGASTTNKYFKNLRETGTVTMIANWTATKFNLPTVSKPGYACKWNTKSDGTGTNYNSGAEYTPSATSGNLTLYAICTANTYTISYTLRNGSHGSYHPTSGTFNEVVQISNPTKTVKVTGNENGTGATIGDATSKAQTFSGWSSETIDTSFAKTGTTASPATAWAGTATTNQYFKNLRTSGTVTMVANWTGVTFNLPTVTKDGYSCKWNKNSDGSGTAYSSGANYTPGASSATSITLYAICTPKTYTVTFNVNGGDAWTETTCASPSTFTSSESKCTKAVTYDSTYGTLPSTTRTGYTFVGWYTEKTGGTKITSSSKVTITANKTLYAHWTAKTYNIGYTMHGGTNSSSNPTSGTYDDLVTISNPTKTFTVTGDANGTGATVGSATSKTQTFSGWTSTTVGSNAKTGTTNNPTTAWDGSSTKNQYFKNLKESGTVTMIANWTAVALNLPTVSKTGWDCKWNKKSDGTGTSYNSGASYTPSATTGSATVYAMCTTYLTLNSHANVELLRGHTASGSVTYSGYAKNISYASSNTSVATINSSTGVITASGTNTGTATITVTGTLYDNTTTTTTYSVTVEMGVARYLNVDYSSIKKAVAAVTDTAGTVYVLKTHSPDETDIPTGKVITIEGGSYNLDKTASTEDSGNNVFTIHGELIVNSSGTWKTAHSNMLVGKGGKLTVNSGTFIATSTETIKIVSVDDTAEVNINGGSFTGENFAIYSASKFDGENNKAKITITGGTFKGKTNSGILIGEHTKLSAKNTTIKGDSCAVNTGDNKSNFTYKSSSTTLKCTGHSGSECIC